jgi:hypothetical protein
MKPLRKLTSDDIVRIVFYGCFGCGGIGKEVQYAIPPEFAIQRPDPEFPAMPFYVFHWDYRPLGMLPGGEHQRLSHRAVVPSMLVGEAVSKIADINRDLTARYVERWGFDYHGPFELSDTAVELVVHQPDPCPHKVAFGWTYRGRRMNAEVPQSLVLLAMQGCAGPDWDKDPDFRTKKA